ncbi:MAG: type II secretion system protein [Cellulosilyticaceae bacterium]
MTKGLTQTKSKKLKKGFTLIELIVVIAIIGVLATMLVPSMLGYVNQSKVAKNDANARTIYTAAQAAYTTIENAEFAQDNIQFPQTTRAEGDTSDVTAFVAKVQELVGTLPGSYAIDVAAGQGVTKVVYSTTAGATTTGDTVSSSTIGVYPKAE